MGEDPLWYRQETVFLINPIDNTKEFAEGSDDFHIQIGLLHKDEVVAGVSYYPAKKTLVWAIKSQGAWMEVEGENKQRLETRPCRENILLKSSSQEIIGPLFPDFKVRDLKCSSTTRLLDMINGNSSLYLSLGASPQGKEKKGGIWNYGFNCLLASEARLILTTLRGTPIDLRDKEALLSEGVVLTNDPTLVQRVVQAFANDFKKKPEDLRRKENIGKKISLFFQWASFET